MKIIDDILYILVRLLGESGLKVDYLSYIRLSDFIRSLPMSHPQFIHELKAA
jgi:hypothetical protein